MYNYIRTHVYIVISSQDKTIEWSLREFEIDPYSVCTLTCINALQEEGINHNWANNYTHSHIKSFEIVPDSHLQIKNRYLRGSF